MAMGDSHHSCRLGRDDCGQRMSRQNTGFFQCLCFVPDGWAKLHIVWDSELDKFRSDALAPELQELTPTITSLLRPRCEDESKFAESQHDQCI